MTDPNKTILYEELSMNAHPALKTQLYDGWILRFSNGYTNRANSVNPLYRSGLPHEVKIEHCENAYLREKLPAVFKLTHELSGQLDGLLEQRGYHVVTPSNIMTRAIGDIAHRSAGFSFRLTADDSWSDQFFSLNGVTDSRRISTAKRMLQNIQNNTLCGTVTKNGQVIACGLCVIERGYAGLFDIVVDSAHRGRGHGFDICASLLSAAKGAAATSRIARFAAAPF